ncbi:hypothetical protein CEP52_007219 [Fusarium oligoseptatum]|uniref:Acyl-CoA thioesterase n=1 Tax=Fusarium oligoseptatum TaxID=2604345 RepID=A0A428TP13_9HYPO|nr:hypothetical protein CEP52_007219 [Fusarium oligoseptatum]
MAPTLAEQVAVEQLEKGEYVSKLLPIRMGNSMPIAYGGCTAGVAVSAACATAPPTMALYSVLGHFHGPASTDRKLHCSVTHTRDTRSFATRRVQVKQQQADGKFRVCMELIADFHVIEPSTLTFTELPNPNWPKPGDDGCENMTEHVKKLVADGTVEKDKADAFLESFSAFETFFDAQYCLDGVAGQNMGGAIKDKITTQDDRHVTDKTSAEWQRARDPLETHADNMAALSFLMDGGLSFLPLTHNHLWFDDVTVCSSLDFALRIFVPDLKLNEWHLKERRTFRAGNGRTFAEGKLWDEHGNLVASESQQSILRLQKGVEPKL